MAHEFQGLNGVLRIADYKSPSVQQIYEYAQAFYSDVNEYRKGTSNPVIACFDDVLKLRDAANMLNDYVEYIESIAGNL